MNKICGYIDHTFLKPEIQKHDINRLCTQAEDYQFAALCIPPIYVSEAKKNLRNCSVKVCTVTGFPLGYNHSDVKIYETEKAVDDGADEIDMVINISAVKSEDYTSAGREIALIKKKAGSKIVKVILETCLLSKEEICEAIKVSIDSGADYVKTSTGFSKEGAVAETVSYMASITQDRVKIKASGGIKTYQEAIKMIDAGASRIGTSSGIAIAQTALKQS